MHKRILIGNAVILAGMICATCMTFCYQYLADKYPRNWERFAWIFGIGGAVLAIATIITAIAYYTNNFGDGFKDKS